MGNKKTLVIASNNQGKVREFQTYFEELGYQVKSLKDFAQLPDVEEDGSSFYENALKKAKSAAEILQVPVLADDSGLEVDRLNGEPGIYSARYAGEPADDAKNNSKLIRELKQLGETPEFSEVKATSDSLSLLSRARYVCVLVLYDPVKEHIMQAEGFWDGYIIEHPRGSGGFGYDPYFYLAEIGKTAAELDPQEKNRISHRGKALSTMIDKLKVFVD